MLVIFIFNTEVKIMERRIQRLYLESQKGGAGALHSVLLTVRMFLNGILFAKGYYMKTGLHGQINLENARVNKHKQACLHKDTSKVFICGLHRQEGPLIHGSCHNY